MRKICLFAVSVFVVSAVFSQDKETDAIQKLIDKDKYIEVIAKYADSTKDYPVKALFNIALAFYNRDENESCLLYINRAIAKDPSYAAAYSIKGYTLNYMEHYQEAIPNFHKAISIDTTNGRFFFGLGIAYFSLQQYDSALMILQQAAAKDKTPDQVYSLIGEIYSIRKDHANAEKAFLIYKDKTKPTDPNYPEILHNIGLMQLLDERYPEAEKTYQDLVDAYPEYYYAYPKLVQIHYHNKNYERATPFKNVLYTAKKMDKLPENLKDMFCIDQFKWNGKLVQVFERYESGSSKNIYYKHLFYLVNDEGDIELRIQTEYSPFAASMKDGITYMLGSSKGTTHSTYGFGFKKDYRYEDVKEAVINVLDKKVTPAASSHIAQ